MKQWTNFEKSILPVNWSSTVIINCYYKWKQHASFYLGTNLIFSKTYFSWTVSTSVTRCDKLVTGPLQKKRFDNIKPQTEIIYCKFSLNSWTSKIFEYDTIIKTFTFINCNCSNPISLVNTGLRNRGPRTLLHWSYKDYITELS